VAIFAPPTELGRPQSLGNISAFEAWSKQQALAEEHDATEPGKRFINICLKYDLSYPGA